MGAIRILLMALAGIQLSGCVLTDWIPIRYEPLPPAPAAPAEKIVRRIPSSRIEKSPNPRTALPRKAEAPTPKGDVQTNRSKVAAVDPEGLYFLGSLYLSGDGVERDYARAIELFREAAREGHMEGERALGYMLENGLGTSTDPREASEWYALAAEQGDARAMAAVGYLLFTGAGIPQDTKDGLRWLRRAGELGSAEGQMLLGAIYDAGWLVAEDDAEALKWYALAAEGGDPLAQFMRGCMLALGEGVPLDIVGAARDYRIAADLGVAEAAAVLGNRYVNLFGDDSALSWKQSLILDGPAYARKHLEKFFRLVEAYKGAALGDADAMFAVGSFYWCGDGFERDFDQALRWWGLAAGLGNERAKSFLERIDRFEKNGPLGKDAPMTRVGGKLLPAGLVYDIGFSLLDENRPLGQIHPSVSWMNGIRRSREAEGAEEAAPPAIRNVRR